MAKLHRWTISEDDLKSVDFGFGFEDPPYIRSLEDVAPAKDPHAVALGRKGGLAGKGRTSQAKAKAAQKNGKKGGRPRKKEDR